MSRRPEAVGPVNAMETAVTGLEAPPASRWYVVQAQPRREQLALTHLERQGFTGFCPRVSRLVRVGRHRVTRLVPFFPGYLFVALDLERQRWRSINGTIGVLRLIAFGNDGRPAPLPGGFVERLAELGTGGLGGDDALEAGDTVRVIGGPFDDLCGILESANDGTRVTILLSLLGKDTRVSIRRESLIAA